MNETAKSFKILSIDAWRYAEGWNWNNWFAVGNCTETVLHMPARKLLKWFREEGYLSASSTGKCAIDDDGYNVVIVDRRTREPLFAIEYGNQY